MILTAPVVWSPSLGCWRDHGLPTVVVPPERQAPPRDPGLAPLPCTKFKGSDVCGRENRSTLAGLGCAKYQTATVRKI